MALENGAVFAGYTVEGLLGSGALGEVYLARHPGLARSDALKILPAPLSGDAAYRELFDREADSAATLRHPGIVALHDRGEYDGRLWVAMEYVAGIDAGRLQREHHPYGMTVGQVLEIVAAAAGALDHAHLSGRLHRHLTPGNVLLATAEPGQRRILLTGFGVARPAGSVDAYTAPEQLMGGPGDGRADQYALAATAFHLLTGAAPHPDGDALARRRPDLAPLDHVLSKAMNREPAQRFSRCADFARALREASGPAPVVASMTAPPVLTAGPWAAAAAVPYHPTRNRGSLAAVLVPSVLAVLLVAAAAFAGVQVLRPQARPSTAPPSWQPYVDYAKQFAVWLTSMNPQSAAGDVQRLLDGSVGAFHDDFVTRRDDFIKTIVDSGVSTQGDATAAALDSLSGTEARVLVAATSKVTNNNGANQDPRRWRLVMRVERQSDAYKVSQVEFVT